jgi:hypothetical protein
MSNSTATSAPTTDEALAIMRELLDAWNAERPASRLSPSAHSAYGPMLFGHVAHVHSLAEGVLTLHHNNQTLVAMPLIRQMIEFTIRSIWLYLYRENLREVVWEGERQRKNVLEAAAASKSIPSNDPSLIRTLDWLEENRGVKGATDGARFQQICEEIAGGDGPYTQYRIASNYTHAGTILVDQYVVMEGAGDQVRIQFRTRPPLAGADAWINTAAFMLILAGITWDHVDKSHLHRRLLRRVAPLFDVPTGRFKMNDVGYKRWNEADRARTRAARDARRKKP